jgi:hypothetical protein
MSDLLLGGFFIRTYESTRGWGVEPASASGVGVVPNGSEPSIGAGNYVAYSFLGVTFWGVVTSMERMRSRLDGDEWAFQLVDNRIRLRWAIVFGVWNAEEDAARLHIDPVAARPSALDQLWGGEVGFDQGIDFTGGLDVPAEVPDPAVLEGRLDRKRMFSHIPPAYWESQTKVYSAAPRTAAQILQEACGAALGGAVHLSLHAVQYSNAVFHVDANSGMSLAALIQQLAEAQGLQVTMDGTSTLRFERPGSVTVVVPPKAHVRKLGTAISSEPTRVRVVGGRRLLQMNNVALEPDWNRAWDRFMAEPVWLAEVLSLLAEPGDEPEGAAGRAEIAARAREITLREYISLKQAAAEDPEGDDVEAEYADHGRWQSISRMDMPVWKYVNSLVFRSYRIPMGAMAVTGGSSLAEGAGVGVRLRSLEMEERLLCAVEISEQGANAATISYRREPVEFYPQASAYVIAQGQPLDLLNSEHAEGLLRLRTRDMRTVWSEVGDFVLDTEAKAIRFSAPVFVDGSIESGTSIFRYPNRGQGGWEDLAPDIDEGAESYLDVVVPNPDYEIGVPAIKGAFVFRSGLFYRDFGVGARWTSHHAPGIAEHLLEGAEGFEPEGTVEFQGHAGLVRPGAGGWREILYENGKTAAALGREQADGLIVRGGVEHSGEYVNIGHAGTVLSAGMSRITVRLDRENGLTETVELAKPRPTRGFVSSRDVAQRLKTEELYDGQVDLQREIAMLRGISKAQRQVEMESGAVPGGLRVMPDVFRKPLGAADHDVRVLRDANDQYPERGAEEQWKAGDLVWLDDEGLPSRGGVVFGGVVVMDSASGYVNVARGGAVPVAVIPGTPPGAVRANPGDWRGGSEGGVLIGTLGHSQPVPGTGEATLAIVRLGAGGAQGPVTCPFGEVISYEVEDEVKTGIRGGLIHCGDQTWNMEPDEIDLTEEGVWLVSIEVTCEVNRDDDGEILLPGVKTGTKPTGEWTRTEWDEDADYPAGDAPVAATGLGKVILPIGKLRVTGEGQARLDAVGCGHFLIVHCAGTLGYARTS